MNVPGDDLRRPGTPGPFHTEWAADDPQTYVVVADNDEIVAGWGYAIRPQDERHLADTRDADAFADIWTRIERRDTTVAYCDALVALAEWDDPEATPSEHEMRQVRAQVAATVRDLLTTDRP